jgi:hypothetical protein
VGSKSIKNFKVRQQLQNYSKVNLSLVKFQVAILSIEIASFVKSFPPALDQIHLGPLYIRPDKINGLDSFLIASCI